MIVDGGTGHALHGLAGHVVVCCWTDAAHGNHFVAVVVDTRSEDVVYEAGLHLIAFVQLGGHDCLRLDLADGVHRSRGRPRVVKPASIVQCPHIEIRVAVDVAALVEADPHLAVGDGEAPLLVGGKGFALQLASVQARRSAHIVSEQPALLVTTPARTPVLPCVLCWGRVCELRAHLHSTDKQCCKHTHRPCKRKKHRI